MTPAMSNTVSFCIRANTLRLMFLEPVPRVSPVERLRAWRLVIGIIQPHQSVQEGGHHQLQSIRGGQQLCQRSEPARYKSLVLTQIAWSDSRLPALPWGPSPRMTFREP
jgi:hypothetical protein